jgi:hypothetical protein
MKIINISVLGSNEDYTVFGLGDDGRPYAWQHGKWVAVA